MTTLPPTTRDAIRARASQDIAARAAKSPTPGKRSRAPSSTGCEYRDDDSFDGSKAISIHAALSTLQSEKFSDMTIICGERQFKIHRAVVCTQSPFFDKAMSGDYMESTSRSIELPEDDPDVVERFLKFLYTGTYSDGVNFTWGKPAKAALLDPESVLQSLQQPACSSQETGMSSPAQGTEDWISKDERDEEPDEEYNEYDEDPDDSSDDGDVAGDEQSKLAKVAEAVAFGHCSRTEGLKQFADLRSDMTLPLRLYVMADKYDVPALRLLARDRIYRAVELVGEEAECFPDVVDELYQTTPPTDTAMREIVCRLVAAVIHVPRVRDKMRSVMIKHGDFAVGVMEYSIYLHTLFV
ncbi:Kelch-like protein 30 [Fusarium oxysporum f. sp. cubense]|uniref:Kelch-like protein 30 n=1 Tax=Fusarium oxysporum f. sp. cubense TaxID=61366 RepID=A0A559LE66_FUSOC|nr:Kelch-like protein 30 [Fusarium oxysporum f. sp. cubense]